MTSFKNLETENNEKDDEYFKKFEKCEKLKNRLKLENEINERRKILKEKKLKILNKITTELESISSQKNEIKNAVQPSDLNIFPLLEFVNEIKKNQKLKQSLENYQIKTNEEIVNSQKFRLINHVGNLSNSLSRIFEIDILTFNKYQEEINKINEKIGLSKKDIDWKISLIIRAKIYLKESGTFFKMDEIFNKKIDLKTLNGLKVTFIEYDNKFMIMKQYNVGELKYKACNLFKIEPDDFFIMDEYFKLIPYFVDIYEEIRFINLEKKCIEYKSRFFQFNPYISENYNLVLIHKSLIIDLFYQNYSFFQLYKEKYVLNLQKIKEKLKLDKDNLTQTEERILKVQRNLLQEKEDIKSKINKTFEILKDERKINIALKEIDNEAYITLEEYIKGKIEKLIGKFYTNNLNRKLDMFMIENKKDESSEYLDDLYNLASVNPLKTEDKENNQTNSIKSAKSPITKNSKMSKKKSIKSQTVSNKSKGTKKSKHPKNFLTTNENQTYKTLKNNTENDEKENEINYRVKIKDSEYLKEEFNDVLVEFSFNLQIFINKCEEYLNNVKNIKENHRMSRLYTINLITEEKDERLKTEENGKKFIEGIEGMVQFILELIKQGNYFIDKKYEIEFKTQNKRVIIENLLSSYCIKEKKYLKENIPPNKINIDSNLLDIEKNVAESINVKQTNEIISDKKIFFVKIVEFISIIVLLFIIYFITNNPEIQIETLSNFNSKIKNTFMEDRNCHKDFLKLTSYQDLNEWLFICYSATLQKYLMRYQDLIDNNMYSIFIFNSDIQILAYNTTKCDILNNQGTLGSTINFTNGNPECFNVNNQLYFYLNKKYLIDSVNLNVDNYDSYEYSGMNFMDTFLFKSRRLKDSDRIRLISRSHFDKFYQIVSYKSNIAKKDKRSNIYSQKINFLYRDFLNNKNYSVQADANNEEKMNFYMNKDTGEIKNEILFNFIDEFVKELTISTFYMNQDIDKIGIIRHHFIIENSIVSTEIFHQAYEILGQYDIIQSLLNILYFLIMIFLIFIFYLKYRITNNLEEAVSSSYFFFISLFIFLLENIYKLYHMISGSLNAFFKPDLVYKIETRDRYIFYMENIRFFNGSISISLLFYLNFVIFTTKDLVVMNKVLKKVLTVFFIISLIFMLAISIFIHITLGIGSLQFSNLSDSFIYIYGQVLGIDTISKIETNDNTRLLKMIMFILRNLFFNFVLAVSIHLYESGEKKTLNDDLRKKAAKIDN